MDERVAGVTGGPLGEINFGSMTAGSELSGLWVRQIIERCPYKSKKLFCGGARDKFAMFRWQTHTRRRLMFMHSLHTLFTVSLNTARCAKLSDNEEEGDAAG